MEPRDGFAALDDDCLVGRTVSGEREDWFLECFSDSVVTSDPSLMSCCVCGRIVLSNRFERHACETVEQVRERENSNAGQAASKRPSAGSQESMQPPDLKKRRQAAGGGGKAEKGHKQPRQRVGGGKGGGGTGGKKGKQGSWSGGLGGGGWVGKTRKISEIIKNGPRNPRPWALGKVGVEAGTQDSSVRGSGDQTSCSTEHRGRLHLDCSLDGRAWWKEWGHLFARGGMGFPPHLRRRRSIVPVRRPRNQLPDSGAEEPDVLVHTAPFWYPSAMESFNDSFGGTLTVLGFG